MTTGYTFCIVDDDAIDRRILLDGLRTAGVDFEAVEVSSVAKALELVDERSFDLVFLDHHLPDGDGLTFLRRARERGVSAPVIVLTGQRDDETAASLVKAGAADYVVKDKVSAELLGMLVPRVIKASRAERKLRLEQERLASCMTAGGIGIWEFRPQTGQLIWDQRCRELFDLGPDDPVDYDVFLSRLHPDDRDAIDRAVQAAFDPNGPRSVDVQYRLAHRPTRWIRAVGRAFFHEGDTLPLRFVGTVSDVSQRKRTEAALAEEVRRVETLQRVGKLITRSVDREGIVKQLTEEATSAVGAAFGAFFYNVVGEDGDAYMLYTLAGAATEDFGHLGMPRATPIFAPTFEGEGTVRYADVTQEAHYGQWGPHHGMPKGHPPVRSYLAAPVISRTKHVIGGLFFGHPEPGRFGERDEAIVEGIADWAAIALDNAELVDAERQARERAERAVAAREDVLAVVSHDLRSPLSVVVHATSILEVGSAAPDQRSRSVAMVRRATDRMTRLLDDLLDVLRAEAGTFSVDLGVVDPKDVVGQAFEDASVLLEDNEDVAAYVDVSDDLPAVTADRERLLQAMANLMTNAIRHTDRGEVRLGATRDGDHVVFSVCDTGSGIPEDHLDHLFDRYWQGSSGNRGRAGLGLAIVKAIVDAHRGEISVESKVDEGTTFRLTIPVAAT